MKSCYHSGSSLLVSSKKKGITPIQRMPRTIPSARIETGARSNRLAAGISITGIKPAIREVFFLEERV